MFFSVKSKKIALSCECCQLAGSADKDAKVTFVVANAMNEITFLFKHIFMRIAL